MPGTPGDRETNMLKLSTLCAVGLLVLTGCGRKAPAVVAAHTVAAPAVQPRPVPPAAARTVDEINPRLLRRFQPVAGAAAPQAPSPDKVALGRALFYEKHLSRDGRVACNNCHALTRFGIDGRSTSTGVAGKRGGRNAPTVYNAATHIAQFWDGRAGTIEEQAAGPILNPLEMAMPNEQAVVAALQAIPTYVDMFRRVFPGDRQPISLKNVGEAIGAFERGLVTTSRWDRYIAGDSTALTAQEKHGLRVFLDTGCMECHTGPQVGGTMFQKVGSYYPWPNQKDEGRSAITKASIDRMVFKVPSLKNIAETAPYFHDGSAPDLETAIRKMGHHQLGIDLDDSEVKAIAAWMRSMTGEIDPAYIAAPTPSGSAPPSAKTL